MTLEAVVYPQCTFTYPCKNIPSYSSLEEDRWNFEIQLPLQENPDLLNENTAAAPETDECGSSSKKRRRRLKRCKNKEAAENQRMSHIAVERNRRRQINDYLSVLRSIMPASYLHKIDQASIIGGAINYVKELEHLLHVMETEKQVMRHQFPFPFSFNGDNKAANIDVAMVESHVNLKVLLRRRPRQLLNMVVGFQNLRLTTLHLNVSTMFDMVLYCFNLKVEEDCELVSVDRLRNAVHEMMKRIEEEAGF